MSQSKYECGPRVNTIAQFEASKSLWFKWRGKTTHRAVLEQQKYVTLRYFIERGWIYEAKLKDAEGAK